jgi:hypothetical protein
MSENDIINFWRGSTQYFLLRHKNKDNVCSWVTFIDSIVDYKNDIVCVSFFFKTVMIVLFALSLLLLPSTQSSCLPGEYDSSGKCIRCPIGSYCPHGNQSILCTPGTYTDLYGQAKCRICRAGTYTIRDGSETCIKCPLGHSCGDRTKLPVICPPGTYADMYEQTKCRACPKGYYSYQMGLTYCNKCPIGYICTDPTKLPEACPIGFYNGLYAQIACRKCKADYTTTGTGQTECVPDTAIIG